MFGALYLLCILIHQIYLFIYNNILKSFYKSKQHNNIPDDYISEKEVV